MLLCWQSEEQNRCICGQIFGLPDCEIIWAGCEDGLVKRTELERMDKWKKN